VTADNCKLFIQLSKIYTLLANHALPAESSLVMIDDLIRLSGYL